jgi:hypothetical protein
MYFYTKERAMYLYPDGIAAMAAQHRDDLIADARRHSLARAARRARRHGATRRASGAHDAGAAHHRAGLDRFAEVVAGAGRRLGRITAGGAGRQGGAGTPAANGGAAEHEDWSRIDRHADDTARSGAERWARIDRNADDSARNGRAARWARLDRDEPAMTREALFAGRTAALAAIAALSVRQSNLAPCGAREAERVR